MDTRREESVVGIRAEILEGQYRDGVREHRSFGCFARTRRRGICRYGSRSRQIDIVRHQLGPLIGLAGQHVSIENDKP